VTPRCSLHLGAKAASDQSSALDNPGSEEERVLFASIKEKPSKRCWLCMRAI
jgi:hypothetical protein